MVQKKLVKKQKLKIVDRDDVPNTYFDDWDTFVIDFPASWLPGVKTSEAWLSFIKNVPF